MLNNCLTRRTARFYNRGGFTLVELLVVIGIIAILAGVALGPITNGIKKAKQSSGVTSAHSIGIGMFSYANDNSQTFPDTTGTTSDAIAGALMSGGYVSDPSIFHLSGDTNSGANKLTSSNNTATSFAAGNGVTSWDFLGNAGSGVDSTKFTWLPILWSTVSSAAPTFGAAATNPDGVATVVSTDPFGTDGVAVYYINNSAAFVQATGPTTFKANLVSAANNLNPTTGGVPTNYKAIRGK